MSARAPVRPKKLDQPNAIRNVNWEEDVRRRAYELYLQRSGVEGSEIDDWLQAEAEMDSIAENRTME